MYHLNSSLLHKRGGCLLKFKTMATDQTDLDIVNALNTILPFEKHLPGMRYCGPGTRLDLRLDEDGKPYPGNEPIDRVDEAALKHDLEYNKYEDLKHRNNADKQMLHDLINIEKPTCRERFERCIVIPILFLKSLIGGLILKFFVKA
jgi:Phospholipase A2-like domain